MSIEFRRPILRARHVAMRKWVTYGVLAAIGLAGCTSESKEEDPDPPHATSKTVCGSMLDVSAGAALKRLAGTDKFRTLEDISGSKPFTVQLAVENLLGDGTEPSECNVYNADDKTGHPVISVEFAVREEYPSNSIKAPRDDPDAYVDYPIGLYAATKDNSSASLLFRCATKGSQGNTPFVRASMLMIRDQIGGESISRDGMTILNSMSRQLAEELGCGDEAKLPTQLPDALPRA